LAVLSASCVQNSSKNKSIYIEEQTKGTLKLKSVSKYNHFMGRYSDTNVEKSAILLLKIEQNGGFLEI
jgi:hypothetical protein